MQQPEKVDSHVDRRELPAQDDNCTQELPRMLTRSVPSPAPLKASFLWAATSLEGEVGLTFLKDGGLAVSSPSLRSVLLFSAEGEKLGPLVGPASIPFSAPASVTQLTDDSIAVLDGRHILLFNGDGGFVRSFFLKSLNIATGLCQDKDGSLILINR